jgi:hypothetical protein
MRTPLRDPDRYELALCLRRDGHEVINVNPQCGEIARDAQETELKCFGCNREFVMSVQPTISMPGGWDSIRISV